MWRDLAAMARRHPAMARLGAMAALARAGAVRPGEMALLALNDVNLTAGRITICRRPQHGYTGAAAGHIRRVDLWASEPVRAMLTWWEAARRLLVAPHQGGMVQAYIVTTRRSRKQDTWRPAGLPVTSAALSLAWRRYAFDASRSTDWQQHFPGQQLDPRFEAMRKAWGQP